MKTFAPALVAGLCLSFSAAAAEKATGTIPVKEAATPETLTRDAAVPYTYAELDYVMTTFDDDSSNIEDGSTIALSGSYLVLPSVFAVGSYSSGSLDANNGASADLTTLQLGAGYRFPLSMTVDLVGTLQYVQSELKDTPLDDSGYQLAVGARGALMDKLEGAGTITYTDVFDDTSTTLGLSALYDLSQWVPKLQAGLGLNFGDDPAVPLTAQSYAVKVRYAF